MLELAFPKYRKRRHTRAAIRAGEPTPVALNLVAAEYEEAAWVRLTFDRPIDISAINGGAITVNDGPLSGTLWVGQESPGMLIGPATVQIELEAYDPSGSTGTVLNAGADSGIVAVDDGGAWAGVTDVELPFE